MTSLPSIYVAEPLLPWKTLCFHYHILLKRLALVIYLTNNFED